MPSLVIMTSFIQNACAIHPSKPTRRAPGMPMSSFARTDPLLSPSLAAMASDMVNDVESDIASDRALQIMDEGFGLSGEIEPLPGERDRNFRLTDPTGKRFVLKISGPHEPAEVTDLQIGVLRWLEGTVIDLSFPRAVKTVSGEDRLSIIDKNGRNRACRLLTYVEGRPLRASSYSADQRLGAGLACATLGQGLLGFSHAAARRDIIWDVARGERLGSLFCELPTEHSRSVADAVVEAIRSRAHDVPLPSQVIHNDLNTGNLMMSTDGASVRGVIDFGDVLHTYAIIDAAIGACSLLTPDGDVVETVRDFMSGYARVRRPSPEEFSALPALIAMRLLLLMVIPAWHRKHNPNNSHYANFDPHIEMRTAWISDLLRLKTQDITDYFPSSRGPDV